MKKTNKSGAFTWAVIFAWVFGIVGVGGVMYMLFTDESYNGMGGAKFDSSYITKSSDSEKSNQPVTDANADTKTTKPVEKKSEPAAIVENTPSTPIQKPVEQPIAKPAEKVIVKPQPLPVQKPVVTPPIVKNQPVVKPVTPPVVKATPVKSTPVVRSPVVTKPHPVAHVADKIMSDGELQQLLANIEQKGEDNGIYAKCVQLHSTSDGNNKKALEQIETFLRSKKYSIAGRETVSVHVKGVKITPANNCMKLTVGSF